MYQSRQERSVLISCLPFASIKLTCRAQKEQSTINKTPLDRSTQCKQKNRELRLHTTRSLSLVTMTHVKKGKGVLMLALILAMAMVFSSCYAAGNVYVVHAAGY